MKPTVALQRVLTGLAVRLRSLEERRELATFRSALRWRSDGPLVVLSPHLDDAVLDCWSVLEGEPRPLVVNVFAALPPEGTLGRWDRITGAADSAQRMRERIAEDAAALAPLGIEPINLSLPEAEYRSPWEEPPPARLDALLAARVPEVSGVLVPAALGTNRDHRAVRRYGLALRAAGIPVTLYADLPYCIQHGWPSWVDGAPPDPYRDVDAFWATFVEGTGIELARQRARVVALDEARAAAKLAALRCYRTQLPALDGGPLAYLSNPRAHGFEVFWELEP